MNTFLQATDVVLLAAGRGRRLGPLTDERPKPLVTVAGRSLLYRNLDQLGRFGVRRLIIVGGYRMGDVRDAVDTYVWAPGCSPKIAWVQQVTPQSEGALHDGLTASTTKRTLVRCADDLLGEGTTTSLLEAGGVGAVLTRAVPDAPLQRLAVIGNLVRGVTAKPSDPIMTYNLNLETAFALDWVKEALRASRPLVDFLDARLKAHELCAVDGASTAGINFPRDIVVAEAWIERHSEGYP